MTAPVEKRKRGRPRHRPTPETRRLVHSLSAVGVRFEDIALKLDISADTLTHYYRRELDLGRIEANASVAQTLFQQAKRGNTVACMFWLKTRARWREVHDLNHMSEDGSMSPPRRIEIVAVDPTTEGDDPDGSDTPTS